MRAFIGVDFDIETKAVISALQKELMRHALKGRWKYPDNFHLTLKFFEEIDEVEKDNIDNAVRGICGRVEAFKLSFSDLDVFKGRDNIRVLWIGLAGGTDKLMKLHNELEDSLGEIGFDKDKKSFKPHVTIGQEIKFTCDLNLLTDIVKDFNFPDIHVDRFHLFKSEQIGSKRIYTKIEEYRL